MPVFFCLRSLVPSVQWQILQSAKMNLAVAQAQPTWNLAWQKMPQQPSRHSVGIPCQTAALWEFMSRKILGQVDSASKWAKLQALQHATHVQISIRCFTEPPTYRLVAIPRKGSWSWWSWEPSGPWLNIKILRLVQTLLKATAKKHQKTWLILYWWVIYAYTYEHSCSIYTLHPRILAWFFGSLYSQVEHWLRRTAAWLCWSSTLMAFASCTLAFRNRRVANVDSTWDTARDWVSQDWVISIKKWVEGVILEVSGHWREPGTELKPCVSQQGAHGVGSISFWHLWKAIVLSKKVPQQGNLQGILEKFARGCYQTILSNTPTHMLANRKQYSRETIG